MNSHNQDQKNVSIRCSDAADMTAQNTAATTAALLNDKENLYFRQHQQLLLSTYRVPRQRRQTRSPNYYAKGLWSEKEQNQFLTGLMLYGWGQWKEIGTIVTTRYVILVKSTTAFF